MKRLFILLVLISAVVFARPMKDIKKSKKLYVAIRQRSGVMEDNKKSGFHYDLAKAFAKENKLKLKIVVKSVIGDYFEEGLFKDVDLIADNLTITEEREKKLRFMKLFPVIQTVISKAGKDDITKVEDLAKETVIVTKDTSYWETVQKLEKQGIKLNLFICEKTSDQMSALLADKGTVTILDSNLALLHNLDERFKQHIPVAEKEYIGWATSQDNDELAKLVEAFFKDNGGTFGLIQHTWDTYIESLEEYNYLETRE